MPEISDPEARNLTNWNNSTPVHAAHRRAHRQRSTSAIMDHHHVDVPTVAVLIDSARRSRFRELRFESARHARPGPSSPRQLIAPASRFAAGRLCATFTAVSCGWNASKALEAAAAPPSREGSGPPEADSRYRPHPPGR